MHHQAPGPGDVLLAGHRELASLLRLTGLAPAQEAERSDITCLCVSTFVFRIYNPTAGGRTGEVALQTSVGQLRCEEVVGLHRRYLPDFTLFQYDIQHTLQMANNGRGCY